MYAGILIAGLQIGTSLARLAGFAFAVIVIGKVAGDPSLLLIIGYLPFLAFFDILIQSSSRAAHLHAGGTSHRLAGWRQSYALAAVAAIMLCFVAIGRVPKARYLLILGAWPLGALGFVWERWIAQRNRQAMLSITELSILVTVVALYWFAGLPWQILLLCIVSYPLARLFVLALPAGDAPPVEAPGARTEASVSRKRVGAYVGSSLAQQLVGAAAASLPALYAQATGDYAGLSINLTVFRSLFSLAAILSLSINAMSSRIFYRQMGGAFDGVEKAILARAGVGMAGLVALTIAAAVLAVVSPGSVAAFSFVLLPIMAAINAESSLLYNRGLPQWTLQCQIMILWLSFAFLLILTGHAAWAPVALAGFLGYVALVSPRMLRAHRQQVGG